jgi:osmotically inducible protein OsmC
MNRKAQAVWRGTGKNGAGELTAPGGVLNATPYSFKTRFEDEPGTNPEELIAAAHAGCFTMALAFQLQAAGFTPDELRTECTVTLEKEGVGFRISRSAAFADASDGGPLRTASQSLQARPDPEKAAVSPLQGGQHPAVPRQQA